MFIHEQRLHHKDAKNVNKLIKGYLNKSSPRKRGFSYPLLLNRHDSRFRGNNGLNQDCLNVIK